MCKDGRECNCVKIVENAIDFVKIVENVMDRVKIAENIIDVTDRAKIVKNGIWVCHDC